MSTLGKVLVVLVLIASVTFGWLAATGYMTRADWQQKYKTVQGKLDTAQTALTTALDAQKEAVAARDKTKKELTSLEQVKQAEITRLEGSLTEARERMKTAVGEKTQLQAALVIAQKNVDAREAEVKRIRGELKDAEQARDKSAKEKADLEDDLAVTKRNYKMMTERNKQMEKQLAEKTALLEQMGGAGGVVNVRDPIRTKGPERAVLGVVKRVGDDGQSVLVTVGSDDQIKKGHRLIIFRTDPQPKFVGELEVVLVRPDEAVCKILPTLLRDAVRKGDHVKTAD